MPVYTLNVNGTPRTTPDVPADMPLLWVLRDLLGVTGPKYGCGVGVCGACTSHINGKAKRVCIRKNIDAESYKIRFTPRKPSSVWSAVNMRNVERLIKEKRMQPAGLKAFAARKENRSGIYAYEQRSPELVEPYLGKLKRNKGAWKFFQAQPPYYRKTMNWWIVSAKQEETRLKRLDKLIEESAQGRRMR